MKQKKKNSKIKNNPFENFLLKFFPIKHNLYIQ